MSGNIFHEIGDGFARRPLLGIAFWYLGGIFAGAWLYFPGFMTAFILLGVLLFLALVLHYLDNIYPSRSWMLKRSARFFLFLLVFWAGWLAMNWRVNNPLPTSLSVLMDRPREGVEVIGVVSDAPILRKNWREDRQYWSFAMKVEEINRLGHFQKAAGEIRVSMSKNGDHPHYGERWFLEGALTDRMRCNNAGQGNDLYRFTFQVAERSVPILLKKSSRWSLLRGCFDLRETCVKILTRGIERRPEVISILRALVLGLQSELPADLREVFVATGTYHVFAISGQHIAIIAMFIIAALQIYGVCRLHWFYYLAPVLAVFTIMTGLSASAVRGCLMALVCFLGPLLKRKPDIASAMALAALLIVIADPRQLFQAGFILSFGIVAGLIILCPPLVDIVKNKIAPDPWRLQPENIPARKLRQIAAWFVFMVIASCAAWAVSTPLIAYWFNLVSPVALLANLLVVPLTTIILLLGCLSILLGWCPFIPEIINWANVWCVSLTILLAKGLMHVPFGYVFVKSPPLWFVCCWLFTLVVWRVWYKEKKIWLSALLILTVAGVSAWLIQKKEWEVHVVNVGGGAVCFVDSSEGKALLNAGPKYQARNVLKYLRRQGVNRLRSLILPVQDAEHCGGASDLIESMPIGEILLAGTKPKSKATKELLLSAGKRKINVRELENGENGLLFSSRYFDVHFSEDTPMQSAIDLSFKSLSVVSTQTACRVVCCPASEEREWPPRATTRSTWQARGGPGDFPECLSATNRIVLGPGQGICFTPGKKRVKVEAVLLGR